jgi:hypothetical protein
MTSTFHPFRAVSFLAAPILLLGLAGCDQVTWNKRMDAIEKRLGTLEKQNQEREGREVNRQACLEACALERAAYPADSGIGPCVQTTARLREVSMPIGAIPFDPRWPLFAVIHALSSREVIKCLINLHFA